MKRSKTEGVTKSVSSPRANSIGGFGPGALTSPGTMGAMENMMNGNDTERAYIGSLVDSYQFKENGLIKKTISVLHRGVHHHLVSYYSLDDIKDNALKTVTETEELRTIVPRPELISSANFRAPVDDNEYGVLSAGQCVLTPNMEYMNGMPHRSLSIPATQPYGHPPPWGSPHYVHGSNYSMSQTLQPTTHYGQQMIPNYAYNAAYGPPRPSGYSSLMQATRRHSAVPSTSGANQLGYSPTTGALLVNGGSLPTHGLPTHGLSSSPYMNGDIFNASAASAAAESASTSSAAGYGATGTISQSNGTHHMGSSASHSTAGFDAQLSNGYEHSMGRMAAMNEYGDSLQEPAGQNFGSTSTSTTPTNLSLGLDQSEMPPTADQEWDRTPSHMPKHESEW